MKRLAYAILLLGLVVVCTSPPAVAQTEITLGGSTQDVTFVGTGSGPTTLGITLGACGLVTCTLSGTANGTGGLLSGPATYSITTPVSTAITATFLGSGQWSVTPGGTSTFQYGVGLLTGTLTLVDLVQTVDLHLGIINTTGTANLTITGGSLQGVFTPSGGVMTLLLKFNTPLVDLSTLPVGGAATARILSGSLTPTPEPTSASLLLLGSGLLLAGKFLRRRLTL